MASLLVDTASQDSAIFVPGLPPDDTGNLCDSSENPLEASGSELRNVDER